MSEATETIRPLSTAEEVNAAMAEANTIAIIKFWATWCVPCKALAARYEKLAQDFPNVKFYSFKCDDNLDVAKSLGVGNVPTLFVSQADNEKIVFGGNMAGPQLESWLKRNAEVIYT